MAQLTQADKDLLPFAVAHALYQVTEIPACALACRFKLAEFLNDYAMQQRIEKKFGYTIKDLREDITNKPINLLKMNPHAVYDNRPVLKNATLKELSYYFFRKLWFVVSLHDRKERRKHRKQQEEGIV